MSIIDQSNLTQESLRELLNQMLGCDQQSDAGIRAVYVKIPDEGWRFLIGKCEVGKGSTQEPKEIFYERYAFLYLPMANRSVLSLLNDIKNDGFVISGKVPQLKFTQESSSWQGHLVPSHFSGCEYPVRRFSARISSNIQGMDEMLLSYGMEFHPSTFEFMTDFLGYKEFESQWGRFIIEVVDRRGRIEHAEGKLMFVTNRHDLCLVGKTSNQNIILQNSGSCVSLNSEEGEDLEAWLLTKDNEIIDFRSSTIWPYQTCTSVDKQDSNEYLTEIINNGESETCELKLFVCASERGDSKALEIAKTVCAFSNQKGGHIFIGVNDETEIVGIETKIRKEYQGDTEQVLVKYINDIQNRLQENLIDSNCFTVKSVQLFFHTVVVISVIGSARVNELRNPVGSFIRRGASNRKLSIDEAMSKQKNVQINENYLNVL